MDQRFEYLIKHGDKLFGDRIAIMGLWQEIGDHFYPERSHFTMPPILGRDFAGHLTTSYPIIMRRDLANNITSMLRPKDKKWFNITSRHGEDDDDEAKQWLDYAAKVQKRAMYDRAAQFVRASKEGDHDFATWGQCVKSVELNAERNGLLYRCWHLKDVVWVEGNDGQICQVHRRWEPTIRELINYFSEKNLHPSVLVQKTEKPFETVEIRHVVLKSSDYDTMVGGQKWATPYVGVYIDIKNKHVIEERGLWSKFYIIPRWQTVSGSQYAYSPATVAALPEARLLQAMTLTLLQAGEKASDPPMLARQGVIRPDVDLRSGGVTWVDAEYDERLGEALRPVITDHSGLPYGIKLRENTLAVMSECFFLNKLNLPPPDHEMTAFEANQRVQEYIRAALPLFEPLEDDDNGQMCEETFGILLRNGAFGPASDIPESLQGRDVQFRFESPLMRAEGMEKGMLLQQSGQMLAAAAQLDPAAVHIVDAKTALRDALYGIGVPPKWMRPEKVVSLIEAREKQQQAAMQAAQTAAVEGEAIKRVGQGAAALGAAFGMNGNKKRAA
jgi:Bacteriophage head to tail connecting protein